jgi:hypothetical protein
MFTMATNATRAEPAKPTVADYEPATGRAAQMARGEGSRLLDHVARSVDPCLIPRTKGLVWRTPSPCDFAQRIMSCPVRYILTDALVRVCIELACRNRAAPARQQKRAHRRYALICL